MSAFWYHKILYGENAPLEKVMPAWASIFAASRRIRFPLASTTPPPQYSATTAMAILHRAFAMKLTIIRFRLSRLPLSRFLMITLRLYFHILRFIYIYRYSLMHYYGSMMLVIFSSSRLSLILLRLILYRAFQPILQPTHKDIFRWVSHL